MASLGGLSEITPLFIYAHAVGPAPGVKPYDPLRLAGKDVYVREGCYLCHSQMIRALRAETQRYGPYSVASESVYDRPFQWGSKRTGPDLARIGGKYSDEWQHLHLLNPQQFVPESNMPSYPWLEQTKVDGNDIAARMRALRAGRPLCRRRHRGRACRGRRQDSSSTRLSPICRGSASRASAEEAPQ
jgi:cytochrome c oxidase cbb3-type subunit 2